MKIYYEKETIQEILTRLRKDLGMSQTTLGKKLGVTHAAISDMERQITNVNLATLEKWANALDKDIEVGLKNQQQ